uniref:DUF4346 domain-containing protein n=1 Tax=Polysiphonia sertularioides TaxID=945028 RepID=A0A1Z1M983_9FLOR|nr:hypothetical protein [Polysiphonia sertularioides]ARW62453.1 hypothetical protein [Polysiphonia sertularioides]
MDNNYFILHVAKTKSIEIHYFSHTNSVSSSLYYPICFLISPIYISKINSLLSILSKLSQCSTSHKLYLGKEIYKAQIAINLNQLYIQD